MKDFLSCLFKKNPNKRLGKNGSTEIKNHVWFNKVNWKNIGNKKIKPPFVPNLKNNTDVSNFNE